MRTKRMVWRCGSIVINSCQDVGSKEICPGTTPEYLSESYFDRYRDILECSEQLGTEVILYDDVDFPSGVLGGRLKQEFPQYTQKRLSKKSGIS